MSKLYALTAGQLMAGILVHQVEGSEEDRYAILLGDRGARSLDPNACGRSIQLNVSKDADGKSRTPEITEDGLVQFARLIPKSTVNRAKKKVEFHLLTDVPEDRKVDRFALVRANTQVLGLPTTGKDPVKGTGLGMVVVPPESKNSRIPERAMHARRAADGTVSTAEDVLALIAEGEKVFVRLEDGTVLTLSYDGEQLKRSFVEDGAPEIFGVSRSSDDLKQDVAV